MEKMSRRKIAYDLKISPYKLTSVFQNDKTSLTFVFSSEKYREKFENQCGEHRKKINQSLSNRFGLSIDSSILADIRLYATIEKRGFLIYGNDGDKFECPEDITLSGLKPTKKS